MPRPDKRPKAAGIVQSLQLDAALNQAQRLRDDGKIADAAAQCQRILKVDPRHSGALHLMGTLALQTGATDIAVGSLQRALAQQPRSAAILRDLGQALTADGRPAEAISAYRKALTIRPRDPENYVGLGDAQLDTGNRADALKSYRKALALDPRHSRAAYMSSALATERVDAGAAYVPELFDSYADVFEAHLVDTLDYHVPERLREAVAEHRPATGRFSAALDLGCGTGLVAGVLDGLVAAIDGIDIAPRMIEVATRSGRYRTLRAGDLSAVMSADDAFAGPYDLVAAADVFIYVGRLESVFPAVRRVLAAGGLFAFSVEDAGPETVAVRSSGRFAHGRAYIAALAAAEGFTVLEDRPVPIRKERSAPIAGRLFVLRAG